VNPFLYLDTYRALAAIILAALQNPGQSLCDQEFTNLIRAYEQVRMAKIPAGKITFQFLEL